MAPTVGRAWRARGWGCAARIDCGCRSSRGQGKRSGERSKHLGDENLAIPQERGRHRKGYIFARNWAADVFKPPGAAEVWSSEFAGYGNAHQCASMRHAVLAHYLRFVKWVNVTAVASLFAREDSSHIHLCWSVRSLIEASRYLNPILYIQSQPTAVLYFSTLKLKTEAFKYVNPNARMLRGQGGDARITGAAYGPACPIEAAAPRNLETAKSRRRTKLVSGRLVCSY